MNELQQLLNAQAHYDELRRQADEARIATQYKTKHTVWNDFLNGVQGYMKSFYSFYTNVAGLGTKMN